MWICVYICRVLIVDLKNEGAVGAKRDGSNRKGMKKKMVALKKKNEPTKRLMSNTHKRR